MTSFHCPKCQRNWSQGMTRDHQETWCWVCQADSHETTTEERDRYREALEDIGDQWGTFGAGKLPSAYDKGCRARKALEDQR